jgi:hypothetical protein
VSFFRFSTKSVFRIKKRRNKQVASSPSIDALPQERGVGTEIVECRACSVTLRSPYPPDRKLPNGPKHLCNNEPLRPSTGHP